MLFVVVGTLLIVLKLADVSPVAEWSWWIVLAPFGLAVAWWGYADATGLTRKRAMQRMEDRKQARRRKAYEALGIDPRRATDDRRKDEAYRRAREAEVRKVESKREAKRQQNEDTIARSSQFHSQLDSTSFGDLGAPAKK